MGAWCEAVVRDPRVAALTPSTRWVLVVGVALWADQNGHLRPRQRRWAEAAGVSLATLKRALDELECNGLLFRQRFIEPGSGLERACNYRVTIEPAPWHGDESGESSHDRGSSSVSPPVAQERATRTEAIETESIQANRVLLTGAEGGVAGPQRQGISAPVDSLDVGLALAIRWLGAGDHLAADEAELITQMASDHPEAFSAHVWDVGTSPTIHRPLAVLVQRINSGSLGGDSDSWRTVVDKWVGEECPRPWLTRGPARVLSHSVGSFRRKGAG